MRKHFAETLPGERACRKEGALGKGVHAGEAFPHGRCKTLPCAMWGQCGAAFPVGRGGMLSSFYNQQSFSALLYSMPLVPFWCGKKGISLVE